MSAGGLTPEQLAALPPNENRAVPALSIYMWIGCGIATPVVATRLATRFVHKKATSGWDDLCIVISYAFAIALYIGTAFLLKHGYGRHIFYIQPDDLIVLLKLNVMVNISGFTSLAFARMSIGLFLLRLTARVRTSAWVVYFGLVLNAVQAAALIILTGLHCVPLKKQWEPEVDGFCMPADRFTAADRFLGCLNVIVDLVFAFFPLYLLRHVQIQRKIRLAVYLLLTCGLLTAVASIGRVVASKLDVEDITWELVPLTYWALSETSGVLILACMPAMRQLFSSSETAKKARSYFQSKMTNTTSKTHPSKHHHSMDQVKATDSASQKDLILPQGNIRLKRDVYVELSDQKPSRSENERYFGGERDSPYHGKAHATTEIV